MPLQYELEIRQFQINFNHKLTILSSILSPKQINNDTNMTMFIRIYRLE